MTVATFDVVQGGAKRVYDTVIHNLLPKSAVCVNRASWEKGTRSIGEAYQIPICVIPPNGFTFAGSTGTATTTLKAGRPMKIVQAAVTPFEMDLREQTLWKNISRMAEQGLGAVDSYFGELMKNMKLAAMNRLEATTLLGQNGVGVVESCTGGSTTATVVITAASWRPGFWWAMGQGSTYDSFTSTTLNNSSGPLILATITTSTRTLTFTCTGTATSECAAADVLYFEGSYDGTNYFEQPGLLVQAANTSGTSLGVSATTYQNWAGNTKSIGGVLSFDVVEDLCGELRDRGCADAISIMVANKNYGGLSSELRSMRIIDSSYQPSKQKTGQRSMGFETPEIGEIEVVIHPFMAWGDVYLQQDQQVARVGSADIGFGVPGLPNNGKEQFLRNVQDGNYAELIMYTDQCAANKRPNFSYKGTGVTQTGT
jgi:hypothetical protein